MDFSKNGCIFDFVNNSIMIKNGLILIALVVVLASCASSQKATTEKGWISLFDGKTLDGWKASEREGVFTVQDGSIVVAGPRSHLYYMGDVMNHDFKNFEFKTKVMTTPGSNSGVYFHTVYQDRGFPDKGFEVQVNNSHRDWKRTAGLYDIQDTRETYVQDSVWFTLYIKVEGKHVVTKINDQTVIDYTEPDDFTPPRNHRERFIDHGTFAIQAHDPKSIVLYKDIMVKPLP